MLILKSTQGVGKGIFTDAICELIKAYAEFNLTNVREISGDFNDALENKILIICNEMTASFEDRPGHKSQMKSHITDKV